MSMTKDQLWEAIIAQQQLTQAEHQQLLIQQQYEDGKDSKN